VKAATWGSTTMRGGCPKGWPKGAVIDEDVEHGAREIARGEGASRSPRRDERRARVDEWPRPAAAAARVRVFSILGLASQRQQADRIRLARAKKKKTPTSSSYPFFPVPLLLLSSLFSSAVSSSLLIITPLYPLCPLTSFVLLYLIPSWVSIEQPHPPRAKTRPHRA